MTTKRNAKNMSMETDVDACAICDVGNSCVVYEFDDGMALVKCLACGYSSTQPIPSR